MGLHQLPGHIRTGQRLTMIAIYLAFVMSGPGLAMAGERQTAAGNVDYQVPPAELEAKVPARFHLEAHSFAWQAKSLGLDSENLEIWDVTFPSPVVTPHEVNNTVHCEYYQPKVAGRRPAVIVLHILGGDFALSRVFCNALAQEGTAALFLKMPYYGPRRPAGMSERMVSPDTDQTIARMTQAVLDIRQATAWLASREEVDPEKLGIMGISLGGITASLAASAEPRLQNVCLLLAGGDLGRIVTESKLLAKHRAQWLATGEDPQQAIAKIQVIDPLNYATNVRGRRIMMLNARDDDVIPPAATKALWEALGKPPIRYFPGGHYSVIWHIPKAIYDVAHFFADDLPPAE
jgi:dienelactone hydrolase